MTDTPEPAKTNWTATVVAVALLAGVAALIAPRGTTLTKNESEAVQALRLVAQAQAEARKRDGRYWTADVRGLAGLPAPLVKADATSADRSAHAGYWFIAMRPDDGYGVCAYPNVHPHDGRGTFIVGADGSVWMKDNGGAPVIQRPQDPATDGWKRMYEPGSIR